MNFFDLKPARKKGKIERYNIEIIGKEKFPWILSSVDCNPSRNLNEKLLKRGESASRLCLTVKPVSFLVRSISRETDASLRCEGYSVAKAGSLSRSFALLVVIFAMVNSSFECAVVPCTAMADVNDSFVLRIRGAVDLAQSQSQQLRGRGTWFKARPISRGIALRLTSAAPRVCATCTHAHKCDRVKEKERENVCVSQNVL